SQGLVVINRGVALGLAGEYIHIKTLMIVAGLILAWMCGRAIWQRLPVATGLFWGGAAANLIDRYWFAGVRDWIPVPMLALKNNLADWSIGVGLVIILTVLLKRSPRGSE
ncbi:signal peptidase II, partial [Candidatus Woesebacteria bacterium]|nr:signal peptidase II [Candidatus Woesebacteria bacterium]